MAGQVSSTSVTSVLSLFRYLKLETHLFSSCVQTSFDTISLPWCLYILIQQTAQLGQVDAKMAGGKQTRIPMLW